MNKKARVIILILSAFLFSYSLVRACILSFTWDEAYSFLEFVRNGIILPAKYEQMSANNHLLNTALDVLLYNGFGNSEIVLRIPSLIAHLLFLYFTYRLVHDFSSPFLAVASFVLINFNPYLLDFFSLSRGYGMSIALMTGSVYFLYRFIHSRSAKHASGVIIFATLATLANFVLLNFMVVIFGMLFLLCLKEKRMKNFIGAMILPLVIMVVSLSFIIPVIFHLKAAGALFYGGNKGFWTDTFSTIVNRYFYELNYSYWLQRIAKGGIIIVMTIAGALSVKTLIHRTSKPGDVFLATLFGLLFFCGLSTIVQHYLLGTLYLQERTALFLLVLFCIMFAFLSERTLPSKKYHTWLYCLFAVIAVLHFARAANFRYVLEWKWDADIKEMLSDLGRIEVVPAGKQNVSLGIPLEMDQGINYYRAKDQLLWLNTVERSDLRDRRYNFLFFGPEDQKKLNMDSVEIIKRYAGTNNILGRPRYPLKANGHNEYSETSKPGFVFGDSIEYGPTINYILSDTIPHDKNAELVYFALVSAPDIKRDNLYVILSVENAKGLCLWKRASVKDQLVIQDLRSPVYFTALVPEDIRTGDIVKAYLWNPDGHALKLEAQGLSWLVDEAPKK
jgi:hypothetical protein